MSQLFPSGISDLRELPYLHAQAVQSALMFLSFHEDMEPDERPPKSIWLDPQELRAHMERVDEARKRKYGGGNSDLPPIEDPVQNSMTAGLRG